MAIHVRDAELHLYGLIGVDSLDEASFNAKDVAMALSEIGNRKAIIYINSPGGSVSDGLAIYNQLKRHKAGVDTHVDGLAASAASIVFLAGSRRTMARNSRLMIHRAHTLAVGNASDLQKTAQILSDHDSMLLDIYSDAMTTTPRAKIEAMLDAETWFDAKSAKEVGLATSIAFEPSSQVPALAAWFKNPPASLLALHNVKADAWAARSRMMRLKYSVPKS